MDQLPSPPYPSLVTTALIVISVIFPVLSFVSILLRNAARRRSSQPFHADDYWITASWLLTFALSVLVWVYAGKAGVDHYKVDFLDGTEASLEVCDRVFTLTGVWYSPNLFPVTDRYQMLIAGVHLVLLRAVPLGRGENRCATVLQTYLHDDVFPGLCVVCYRNRYRLEHPVLLACAPGARPRRISAHNDETAARLDSNRARAGVQQLHAGPHRAVLPTARHLAPEHEGKAQGRSRSDILAGRILRRGRYRANCAVRPVYPLCGLQS